MVFDPKLALFLHLTDTNMRLIIVGLFFQVARCCTVVEDDVSISSQGIFMFNNYITLKMN